MYKGGKIIKKSYYVRQESEGFRGNIKVVLLDMSCSSVDAHFNLFIYVLCILLFMKILYIKFTDNEMFNFYSSLACRYLLPP